MSLISLYYKPFLLDSTASNSSQVGCDFLGITVPSEFGLSYISDCCTALSTCYNTCDNKEETCCQAFWSCLDCNNSISQNTTQTSEMELINQEGNKASIILSSFMYIINNVLFLSLPQFYKSVIACDKNKPMRCL